MMFQRQWVQSENGHRQSLQNGNDTLQRQRVQSEDGHRQSLQNENDTYQSFQSDIGLRQQLQNSSDNEVLNSGSVMQISKTSQITSSRN